MVFNIPRVSRESTTELLGKLDWAPLEERRSHRRMCLFRAMHFVEVNAPLSDLVVPNKKTGTRRHNFSTEELSTIRPNLTHVNNILLYLYKQRLEQAGPTGQTPLLPCIIHCASLLDYQNQTRNEIRT